jgi:hypothetical protein
MESSLNNKAAMKFDSPQGMQRRSAGRDKSDAGGNEDD